MLDHLRRLQLGKQYGYKALFKAQDTRPVGKVGVVMGEVGMPEAYDFAFYNRYMAHVFRYSLPPVVRQLVLADRGVVLLDPANPLAREPFEPSQLIDCYGSFTNRAGKPYVACKVAWRSPARARNPWDHGHFLYTAEGKSGNPDICEKTGAKVVGWYYGALLPEKKVPWRYQLRQIYDESVRELRHHFPQVEFRLAYYINPGSVRRAVEELLDMECETIVYQSICNPVHSDFEEYAYALPMIHRLVNRRAKVICADQLGRQPALRDAYVHMIRDRLADIPARASVFLILSTHGHPFRKETQDARAPEYRIPLAEAVSQVLEERGAPWDLTWSSDEYADDYWDPKNAKKSTFDAYQQAIAKGYDYAIEMSTEFLAENTDLMIRHAMAKFAAFSDYDVYDPVPYPDWDRPLIRIYHSGQTTGIYAGCPVGPYRHHVVEAVVNSVGAILTQA